MDGRLIDASRDRVSYHLLGHLPLLQPAQVNPRSPSNRQWSMGVRELPVQRGRPPLIQACQRETVDDPSGRIRATWQNPILSININSLSIETPINQVGDGCLVHPLVDLCRQWPGQRPHLQFARASVIRPSRRQLADPLAQLAWQVDGSHATVLDRPVRRNHVERHTTSQSASEADPHDSISEKAPLPKPCERGSDRY